MATISPNTVVNRATLIPLATIAGEISPAASIASKAPTIPITVPREAEHRSEGNE